MYKKLAFVAGVAPAIIFFAVGAQSAPSVFGTNLIVNGGAEADTGSPNDSGIVKPHGWATSGNFTVVQYGASGGFPALSDPGPTDRGKNFFAGGPSNAQSSAMQVISLSMARGQISSGLVSFRLSGYLGGYTGQNDNDLISATFVDAAGRKLGSASIGPVTAANRNAHTGLLLRSTGGSVPRHTHSVVITITATRVEGSYNDGECDNLQFVLSRKR